jgi:cell division septation protein DedD
MAAAAGLLLLIFVGFAVGIVAGMMWEEPNLLLAHLVGETEEVSWSEQTGEGRAPQVAAPPPRDEGPADPQTRREQERAVEAETREAAVAPVGRIAVQVGAFETSRAAENLANSLRAKGYPVYVSPGVAAGKERWRVRVGPLVTREEAKSTAARLKKVEKLPTWILSEDAG